MKFLEVSRSPAALLCKEWMGQVSLRWGAHVEIRVTEEHWTPCCSLLPETVDLRWIFPEPSTFCQLPFIFPFLFSVFWISKSVFPVDGGIAASCSSHFFGSLFLCICIWRLHPDKTTFFKPGVALQLLQDLWWLTCCECCVSAPVELGLFK